MFTWDIEMVSVDIMVLGLKWSTLFKLRDVYDFRVYCTDGEKDWLANCYKKDLQECVELGISAFT